MYVEKEHDEEDEEQESKPNVTSEDEPKPRKAPIEKKINFAIISTLVD
jgi:hypothetical protein